MEKQKGNRYLWVAGVAGASLVAGCGNPMKQWAKAPGTNGFINLDAVKAAFQKNRKVEDFETRVNKIYEGDHMVLFNAALVTDGFELTAKEDLNDDKKLDTSDDTLFTLTVKGKVASLKGSGVNAYYSSSWVYTPPEERRDERHYSSRYHHGPHFHYWYWGRGWGGYHTPASRYSRMRNDRDYYRNSSAFHSQVKRNVDYETRASKQYGAGFRKSASKPSATRKSYVAKGMASTANQKSVKTSKSSSGWGVRSKMGTTGSFAAATASRPSSSKSKSTSRSTASRSSSSSKSYGGFRGSSGVHV
jgi:hypothetical protein